ncbi:hypothetical protein ABZ478_33605 [Streptomyces sp. NPDC005706]|uniref:hypothetical protein n=1 Tax=Streptomyces sp. NPDC005706 TaxID=3157169 RepID=UPI0033C6B00F
MSAVGWSVCRNAAPKLLLLSEMPFVKALPPDEVAELLPFIEPGNPEFPTMHQRRVFA